MTITTEELARIRAAAVGDMLGDSEAFDELGPAATIFRLCNEVKDERGKIMRLQDIINRVYRALSSKRRVIEIQND